MITPFTLIRKLQAVNKETHTKLFLILTTDFVYICLSLYMLDVVKAVRIQARSKLCRVEKLVFDAYVSGGKANLVRQCQ